MRRLFTYLSVIVILISWTGCSNDVFFNPFRAAHTLKTIKISNDFTWSLTTHVDLDVVFELVGDSIDLIEGERIYLLDTNYRVLTQGIIENEKSHLDYKVPFNMGVMYAYLPLTQNFEYVYSTACLGTLTLRYGWDEPDEDLGLQVLEFPFAELGVGSMKSDRGFKASVFSNEGFSIDELSSASRFKSSDPKFDGTWYHSTSNKAPATIEAYQGNSALKLGQQKGKKVEVWQAIEWSDEGTFTVQLRAISPDQKRMKVKLRLYFLERDDDEYEVEDTKSKSYNIKNPSGWQTLEVSDRVDDDIDAIIFLIEDQGGSDDIIYIDDISTNYDTDDDGIPDDEDEFPADPNKAFVDHYPSEDQYGTLAFEDLWPAQGDYDFNDLVVDYQFATVRNADNKTTQLEATIYLRAIGGSFHNGFGIELPIDQNLVSSVSGNELREGIVETRANGTESGADNAIIMVFEDACNYLRIAGVSFVNVHSDEEQIDPYVFNVVINFTRGLTDAELGTAPFNPFIFTNGRRNVEVHLFGNEPTVKMDLSLLGTVDDYSSIDEGNFFKTVANLPWALDIPSTFDYPEEKFPVDEVYNHFIEWAETSGISKNDWYQNKNGYRDLNKIFQKQ